MKGKMISAALAALLTVVLAAVVLANGVVQTPAPAAQGAGPATYERNWTTCELLTLTVAEAWQRSGQNYEVFTDMIEELAAISVDKRGIDVPNNEKAGNEIGEMIRARAEADPDQLLFTVVDSSMRDYAAKHPETMK